MCRMCLVEVDTGRGPALQPGCMIECTADMKVDTDTDGVQKAQDGVLEFLLINHPLDCPVCDKGGECPLQDQTMAYGPGESRWTEEKRHYPKPIPISETVYLDRERCILCDRCTRFATDVAGDPLIHFMDRGANTEVNTFPDEPFASYFSRQHGADLPGRSPHRQAVPLQGPALGPRPARVDLHRLLGGMSHLGAVVAQPGAALPRRRQRPGQLGLVVRQGPLRLRGRQLRRADSSSRWSAPATSSCRHAGPRPSRLPPTRCAAAIDGPGDPDGVALIGGRGSPTRVGLSLGQADQGRHRLGPRRRPAR